MKKIKTFEDACAALGISTDSVPDLSALPEPHQKSMTAFYKLRVIAEALNEGWQPDWSNSNQYKWMPWFEVKASAKKPSGSGLSCHDADGWVATTAVGSRLCFKSRELCEYAATQFADLYSDLMNH